MPIHAPPRSLLRPASLLWLGLLLLLLIAAAPVQAAPPELRTFSSKHYDVNTDLERDEAMKLALHMDAVYGEYGKRFASFRNRNVGRMPLYLLRNREGYVALMQSLDIDASNSDGMFFVTQGKQGLATWTSDRSRETTYSVLQHEGFHQFAWSHIGPDLPTWANEGIAQYFGDALLVRGRMTIGLIDAQRLAVIQQAVQKDALIPMDKLMDMDDDSWNRTRARDPEKSGLLYAQGWGVTYFLIHADDGKYQQAFVNYLRLLSNGKKQEDAFNEAFGTRDTKAFTQRWSQWVLQQQPDPINVAVTRMEVLGTALKALHEKDERPARNIKDLRAMLQRRRFVVTRQGQGVTRQYDARDEELYTYPTGNNGIAMTQEFRVLEPTGEGLPPRLTAPGLSPEPTLVWSKNAEGGLVQEVVFR